MILCTASRTIEKHVENLLKTLQVENRTTAALQLFRAFRDRRAVVSPAPPTRAPFE